MTCEEVYVGKTKEVLTYNLFLKLCFKRVLILAIPSDLLNCAESFY